MHLAAYLYQNLGDFALLQLEHCAQWVRDNHNVEYTGLVFWRYLCNFISSAQKDGKVYWDVMYGEFVPLLHVMGWFRKEPSKEALLRIMTRKLREHARSLLKLLRQPQADDGKEDNLPLDKKAYIIPPPMLFGLLIKGPIVEIVTYEPLSKDDKPREFASFRFSSSRYKSLNCLTLAIVAVHCRNSMMKMKEALKSSGLYTAPVFPPDHDQ